MQKIKYNKFYYLLFIIIPMVILFFSFNNKFMNRDRLLISTIYSYLMVVVMLYVIHLLTFCIQIIILKVTGNNIYIFSCYPFSFDGVIRFKPIKMMYHQELYETQIPYNIVSLINGNDDIKVIRSQFKRNVLLWVLSRGISIILVWFVAKYLLEINLGFELAILFIANITTQYMFYNNEHYGYLYAFHNKDLEVHAVIKIPFKFVDFKIFSNLFARYDNNDDQGLGYKLLNSYFYKCIEQKKAPIKIENFKKYIEFKDNLSEIPKLINCVKMVGLVGKICDNDEYLYYSIQELVKYKRYYFKNDIYGIMDLPIERIQTYIEFLNGENKIIDAEKQLPLGVEVLYACGEEVEKAIIKFCNRVVNL